MTDERLNQILKQALTPEVSDSELEIRVKERKHNMKKTVKSCIAAAACLALAVAVGIGGHYLKFNGTDGENTAESNDLFTLTAYAEELTPEKEVPVVIENNQSWVLGGGDNGTVYYTIETFFKCEGNNIKSITYAINKGAFQIVEMPGKSIIVDAKEYEGAINAGMIGGVEDENGTILTENKLVTEYTVLYDAQTNDTTWFSICDEKNSPELEHALWPENGECSSSTEAEVYTQLVDGVEITCTVSFTDGTSASKTITVEGKVMTYEEAGIYCKEDGGIAPDTESAFFVFGLK